MAIFYKSIDTNKFISKMSFLLVGLWLEANGSWRNPSESRKLSGRTSRSDKQFYHAYKNLGKRMILLISLICFTVTIPPFHCSAAVKAPSPTVSPGFKNDLKLLRSLTENIDKNLEKMEQSGLFVKGRTRDFDITEKKLFYQLWGVYLDHILAFESIINSRKNFYMKMNRRDNADSFLLAYAAYLAKFSSSLKLIRLTIDNELYEKNLDDINSEYGIPAGMFARLKWNTIHIQDVSGIHAGYQYYRFLGSHYSKRELTTNPETAWIFEYINSAYEQISNGLKLKGVSYFSSNGIDVIKEKTFTAWFPLQMSVSGWMGDTKVKRKNRTLIKEEQLTEMKKHLFPGDIIVERRNWYLSNIGLPGFWPHAELYTGDYSTMQDFFSEPAVIAHYKNLGPYKNFMDYLKQKYPEKMKLLRLNTVDGHPFEIIEAVSEGVKFSTMPEAALADYIAVVRPRLSKLDIAQAVEEAISYIGRPYDFNFDFLTDSSIVCSELIYKIFKAAENKKGLNLSLREIAGRMAMPANDLVEKFDKDFDSQNRELDFVYFLEGSEKDQKAFIRSSSEFRTSHKRLKWDIMQK